MKEIHFYKYQGTGNDFIIIDQLKDQYDVPNATIQKWCDRRYGIGGDGLMYLRKDTEVDFQMVYYNADGNESTMCGNGGRCISHLYFSLTGKTTASFKAVDGIHVSHLKSDGIVALKMNDVDEVRKDGDNYVIDTGSPHFIKRMDEINDLNVDVEGRKIRYNSKYMEQGINVNFMALKEDFIEVRTYERGVEGETLSCGTGVTACALAADVLTNGQYLKSTKIFTKGGQLQVTFQNKKRGYADIWLIGPATKVFKGHLIIDE
jgi:diaminopimelate epimerase